MSLESLLNAYTLAAEAEGSSPKTVAHLSSAIRYFADFLGGLDDAHRATTNDSQPFIVALQRKIWQKARWSKKQR